MEKGAAWRLAAQALVLGLQAAEALLKGLAAATRDGLTPPLPGRLPSHNPRTPRRLFGVDTSAPAPGPDSR
jgi:hypothetical protein